MLSRLWKIWNLLQAIVWKHWKVISRVSTAFESMISGELSSDGRILEHMTFRLLITTNQFLQKITWYHQTEWQHIPELYYWRSLSSLWVCPRKRFRRISASLCNESMRLSVVREGCHQIRPGFLPGRSTRHRSSGLTCKQLTTCLCTNQSTMCSRFWKQARNHYVFLWIRFIRLSGYYRVAVPLKSRYIRVNSQP